MKRIVLFILLLALLVIAFFLVRKPISHSYNKKGIISYNDQNFLVAMQNFKRAVSWYRANTDALINLTKTQLTLEKIKDAGESLKKLQELNPDAAGSFVLEGQLLIKLKKYEKAIEILSKALDKDSLMADAYYFRGIARANLNDLDGSVSDYLKAQELGRRNKAILEETAIVLSKLENYVAAIENYNKLLELDPSNTNAFLQRGIFKRKIGDVKNAIEDFNKVLELSPNLSEAIYNRGNAYAQDAQYEKAIADFENSLRLKYKIAGSNYNIALSFLKLNKPAKAKKYLEASIKNDDNAENTSKTYHLLGLMEMMQEKYGNAVTNFNKSIKSDPKMLDAYYNRAIAYSYQKQYKNALLDLDFCIKSGKKTADVYYARGVQRINLNDKPGGCEDFAQAKEMNFEQALDMIKIYCNN